MNNSSKRLTPSVETIKKLLLRSGNECAFPDCNEVLFNDKDELIAECCHIESALPGGERYNPSQSVEERRSFDNLLFLCHKHHVQTNDVSIYTVEFLKKLKRDHERRFREKTILINPNQIQNVIESLEEIRSNIKQTSDTVKRIEDKQNVILEILNNNIPMPETGETEYYEYFGVPPVHQFKGRGNELSELKAAFGSYNFFLIGGLSGIGKTSLIAQFLTQINSHKVFWVDCELVKTKELFFANFSKFIRQEFSDKSIEKVLTVSDESVIQKYLFFILQKYQVCVVFDALNSNEHNLVSLLQPFNEHLNGSKLVISTNRHIETLYWRNPACKIALKGLDEYAFDEIFRSYNLLTLIPRQQHQIYLLLNGHPFLLKLCASILEYQPPDHFISQLENQGLGEIAEYISQRFFESLTEEELELAKKLAILEIPFRYNIGDYILQQTFSKAIKGLQQKFLIESFHEIFFIIPEFIRTHIKRMDRVEDQQQVHISFVNYLLSIKNEVRIFERNALVYHALESDLLDIAKKEASGFLYSLMDAGKFNLVNKIASDIERNPKANKWSFIYYIQGRVFRFQEDYAKAKEKYEIGLKLGGNSQEENTFKFERASVLTYLSTELDDEVLLQEAVSIYEELSRIENATLYAQCQLSLAAILLRSKKYSEVIVKLERLTETINESNIQINVKAGMWQLLGDAYSKNNEYQKAFISFDKSIDLYKKSIETFGMNVIDGLYHLYESYGWTYASAGDYIQAAEMFNICVSLCYHFDLKGKLERALFDYGFHLTMSEQFDKAIDVLSDHYSYITDNNLVLESDMPFIHGTLAFAHWYNGTFTEAVELMGLYILSCYKRNIQPMINLMEEDGMTEKLDVVSFFKTRIYIFIIPSSKSFDDFSEWINIVCSRRPELMTPLSQFLYVRKNEEKDDTSDKEL